MRTKREILALMATLRARLATAQTNTARVALYARIETLQWVLGANPEGEA